MRKKPLALILSSCVFLLFPIQLGFSLIQGEPFTPTDFILSVFFPVILTLGLLRVEKLAWYTLFGFIFLWGIKDYSGFESEKTSLLQVITHLVVYLLGLTYFINPRIKRLYFDPRLQWWRTKRRFETHGPAIIQSGEKTVYPTLRNISEGGCFLETPHTQDVFHLVDLIIPLPVPLKTSCLKFVGEVRWVSENPALPGMGIQFQSLSRADQQLLKDFLRMQ